MKRTHNCGELSRNHIGKDVLLSGWVHSRRDHGGVIFIDLRDRHGLTQIVFDPSHDKKSHQTAELLRRECVISISGKVRNRREGMVNPKLATGEVEVLVDRVEIHTQAETPPLEIEENAHSNEEIRLKYRYLDLRRFQMQKNLEIRHRVLRAVRDNLDKQGFIEIETPLLVRSTPEGSRDFIVPSRLYPGKIYALPQSPQLYKQILMISGFDRYYQIAKCFRDEDLRADRQPVHTQIDIEMAFVSEEDIFAAVENMLKDAFRVAGKEIVIPFRRITYGEAIGRYGTEKPDLRFGLEIIKLEDILKETGFEIFSSTINSGGWIRCIKTNAPVSRKEIEEVLTEEVKVYGAKGLLWLKMGEEMQGPVAKFLDERTKKEIIKRAVMKKDDILLIIADTKKVTAASLAALRNYLGKKLGLIKATLEFCWVTDFPLFEWNEELEKWDATHHIFTSPKQEHIELLEKDPGRVQGRLYDLVLNGTELGSGSIRINNPELQKRVMKVTGIDYKEAEKKFGFLLEAYRYGAPPHGGIALGVDRVIMQMVGAESIRDVIAFPMNKAMVCPMDGCPTDIDDDALRELHLKLDFVRKRPE